MQTSDQADQPQREPPPYLRFNYIALPPDVTPNDLYPDDPVWELVYREIDWWPNQPLSPELKLLFPQGLPPATHRRPRGQRIARVELDPKDVNACLFPPHYSYCAYEVSDLGRKPEAADLGKAQTLLSSALLTEEAVSGPPQAKHVDERLAELPDRTLLGAKGITMPATAEVRLRPEQAANRHLIYLFNLIVALEWEPDNAMRQQLAWAFRRASDFLYDVSNGRMAFGQVLIGWSPAYFAAADLVLAASNRIQGRSWVGSIHEPTKRVPIRVGRGDWRRTYCIPWDEPEGYKVLVHEWAHYALHLRDAYLEPLAVKPSGAPGAGQATALVLAEGDPQASQIMAPKLFLNGTSVMEALDGVSELSLQIEPSEPSEQRLLETLYPGLPIENPGPGRQGPGLLRLPLPQIIFAKETSHIGTGLQLKPESHRDTLPLRRHDDFAQQQQCEPYDRCWLYIVSPRSAAQPRLIAQGTLDIRSRQQPFDLLGAEPSDWLVAVVHGTANQAATFVSRCVPNAQGDLEWVPFAPITLEAQPLMEVLPQPFPVPAPTVEALQGLPPAIWVRVALSNLPTAPLIDEVWLCPLGGTITRFALDGQSFSFPDTLISSLDGHLLLWSQDRPYAIGSFSHGGSPPTHTTGTSPGSFLHRAILGGAADLGAAPAGESSEGLHQVNVGPSLTAGSSDGNVRLYFSNQPGFGMLNEQQREEYMRYYSTMRTVTTIQNGCTAPPPQAGAIALSYPFSLATNRPLRAEEIHLTLEVRYSLSARTDIGQGEAVLCQLDPQTGTWQPVPTFSYAPYGAGAVATYLPISSPLYQNEADQRVERYRLWWLPK